MADNSPIAAFSRDDPGNLHRKRRGDFVEEKVGRRGKVDQVRADLRGVPIGKFDARRAPSRQGVEIGGDALPAAIERRV
jgi:hypothetical protein